MLPKLKAHIPPMMGSAAGFKVTEEQRAKVSANRKGKGKAVHLIQVTPSGLKHVLSFPSISSCAEALGLRQSTLSYRLENKVVFRYNASKHFISTSLLSNLLP